MASPPASPRSSRWASSGHRTPAGSAAREAAPALSVSGLGFRVGAFQLHGIELSVAPGEGVAIIGTNGAGKTTVIRLAAGLLRPSSGQVSICGLAPRNWGRVSQHLGYVQQAKELPDGVSVETYVKHQLKLRRAEPARYGELIRAADLGQYEKRYVRTLSGGSQRKLHIICAVAHRPSLLILDEPTAGLDPTAQEAVLDLLRALKKEGVGILFASHHRHELLALADSIVVLHQGRQIQDASLADVLYPGERSTLVLEAFDELDVPRLRAWAGGLPQQYPSVRCVHEVQEGAGLELDAGTEREAIGEVVARAHDAGIALRSVHHSTPTLAEIVRTLIAQDAEGTS